MPHRKRRRRKAKHVKRYSPAHGSFTTAPKKGKSYVWD